MSEQSNINLNELNKTLSQNVIHYETTRVDYTINDSELNQLEEIGKNMWKEVFFATLGIAIPCLINAYSTQSKIQNEIWSKEVFMNYLFGGICGFLSLFSLIIWISTSKKKTSIINKIKNKPQFILPQ